MADDLGTSSLAFSPGFKGEDCDAIAKILKKSQIKKDEFESTASYEQRLQGILDTEAVSNRPLAEAKLFVNSEKISSAYDADKGLMKIYGSLRQSVRVSESVKYASVAILRTRSSHISEYQGQNNFGASKVVKKYRNEVCGVAFMNVSPSTDFEWMSAIEFPLSPDVARKSKENLALVYQASLRGPLLVDYRQHIAPTMEYPSDILTEGDALTAVLERYFVINKETGEILFERLYTPR